MTGVAAHVAVPLAQRDLAWIKSALQIAIAVEHATMPPYIAATYSLQVQSYTAYNLLRSVAMEEMAHMAAGCNILAALGGAPQIKALDPVWFGYGLPGGAEPDLFVSLAALSKAQLANFLRLEAPLGLVDPRYAEETYPSIPSLYAAIRAAVEANAAQVRAAVAAGGTANQVGDNIGFATIARTGDAIDQILSAIDAITSQGEGVQGNAMHAAPGSEREESHYARFAQIYFGRHLTEPPPALALTPDTLPRFLAGSEIPFPVVTNTLVVPRDGYQRVLALDPAAAAVEKDLAAFDQAYSDMMAGLEACWNGDPAKWWPTLGASVTLMAKLRVLGCFNVMRHQVPPAVVAQLATLYPDDFAALQKYTRLDEPVYYGVRFRNLNVAPAAAP